MGTTTLLILAFGWWPAPARTGAGVAIRLGYFPNVTHAPALVGVARSEFQTALGAQAHVNPKVFNAGPDEMEALLAGEIDAGYVGPSPALNTYLKSNGKALRILAGACSGGASLVARGDTDIRSIPDLNGRRLAIPQLGGTQDVAARHFLSSHGLQPREKGGTVEILPVKNPDILALFKRKQLDAAWVPEPWASRLVAEGNGRLVVDERDLWPNGRFTTTVLVARTKFLEEHPALINLLLQAHLRSVEWLGKNPEEGQAVVNAELKRLTGKELAVPVLKQAWSRLAFVAEPDRPSIEAMARAAAVAGYLPGVDPGERVDLATLFVPEPLAQARRRVLTLAP